jgi:hypothetical protein
VSRGSGERFALLHSFALVAPKLSQRNSTGRMPVLHHRTETADDVLQTPSDLA